MLYATILIVAQKDHYVYYVRSLEVQYNHLQYKIVLSYVKLFHELWFHYVQQYGTKGN